MSDRHGWIGVDFDGTLATYEYGQYPTLGAPIDLMVERVKRWLEDGVDVRIFTARVDDTQSVKEVTTQIINLIAWCKEHIGQALPITCRKDMSMLELWDDRAVTVEKNTGRRLTFLKGLDQ